MLLATWVCILSTSLCELVYSVHAETDKTEDTALEEQQMDNLAEWMSSAFEKGDGKRSHFLEKLRMDETSKRDDNKEEAPGFVGVRGKRKNSDDMFDSPFATKRTQSETYAPGFVAVRGKKKSGSTGKKGNPPGFIGVRGRRQQREEQKGTIPPGFIAPRGKKEVVVEVPGYIASRGKRNDIPPGFIGVRGRRQDVAPGFIGVRGRRDGLVALVNGPRSVDEHDLPLVLVRKENLYDLDISQDDNEEDMEREIEIRPEIESKQVLVKPDVGKLYIDCIKGNDYFCRRFVAIKG